MSVVMFLGIWSEWREAADEVTILTYYTVFKDFLNLLWLSQHLFNVQQMFRMFMILIYCG